MKKVLLFLNALFITVFAYVLPAFALINESQQENRVDIGFMRILCQFCRAASAIPLIIALGLLFFSVRNADGSFKGTILKLLGVTIALFCLLPVMEFLGFA